MWAWPVYGYSAASSTLACRSTTRVISRARSRRLARIDLTIGGRTSLGAFTRYPANMLDNSIHAGSRSKDAADTHFFKRRNVFVGDDPANNQLHIVQPIGFH